MIDTSPGEALVSDTRPALFNCHAPAGRRILALFMSTSVCAALAACTQSAPPPPPATAVIGTAQAVASAIPTLQAAGTGGVATASVVRTEAAGTIQSASTQVSGTAQAVVSAVAPTVVAGQTQTAPTLSALQTQIAPTAAAASTQAAGTLQPVVATAVAGSPVQISQVQINDTDTTIAIRNSGQRQVNIGGWILFMGAFPFVLPTNANMRIDPNQTLTLHLSRGTDSATDVYVGDAPGPLLNNLQNGAPLVLVDLTGQLASVYRIP
jgi:hypothetical protein